MRKFTVADNTLSLGDETSMLFINMPSPKNGTWYARKENGVVTMLHADVWYSEPTSGWSLGVLVLASGMFEAASTKDVLKYTLKAGARSLSLLWQDDQCLGIKVMEPFGEEEFMDDDDEMADEDLSDD